MSPVAKQQQVQRPVTLGKKKLHWRRKRQCVRVTLNAVAAKQGVGTESTSLVRDSVKICDYL